MGLLKPNISSIEGQFSEVIGYNVPFVLHGIEIVEGVKTQGYGVGTMVVVDAEPENGPRKRLGVWGQYLIEQAKSAEPSDFGKAYKIVQGPVEGYSDRPDTKSLVQVQ